MGTTRQFQDMLNEYTPNKLLMAEYIKRDWLMSNVEIDNSWKEGKLIVPFRGARASSIAFGELTASNDISSSVYVRGYTDAAYEVWGTLVLYHRDLMDHSGKIPESTFLKLIPDEIEALMQLVKESVSTQLINGTHFATLTADGDASGNITVDHIDRFEIGQKFDLDDGNSSPLSVYVIAINVNSNVVQVSASRGGAAADVSAYTTAQTARCYHPGVLTNGAFTSLRSALLSAANGGSSTIHNVSKLLYPHLQAVNILGSSISASNILDKLFDAYTTVRQKAKGNANTIVMSFKHLGSVMKLIETQKGPFVVTKAPNASLYGWTEIEITSVKGTLKLVGIVEMDDDVIFYLDMKSFKFYTNGGFRKRAAPDGREYFEVRATSGYAYIVDCCLFGEMGYLNPSHNAVIYGISY